MNLESRELEKFCELCQELQVDPAEELAAKVRELTQRVALKKIPSEGFLERHGCKDLEDSTYPVRRDILGKYSEFLRSTLNADRNASLLGDEGALVKLIGNAVAFYGKKRATVSPSVKRKLQKKHLSKCVYCGSEVSIQDCVIDHFVPVYHGGSTKESNLRYCCERCNSGKAHLLPEMYLDFDVYLPRDEISNRLRYLVLVRDRHACVSCGKTAKKQTLRVEPKVKMADGGFIGFDNLTTVCSDCHEQNQLS